MIARVSNLHNIEADWAKHADLIPKAGEIIVYDPDENFNFCRVKIGDGKTALKNLDFFLETTVEHILEKHKYSQFIDSGRITDYK